MFFSESIPLFLTLTYNNENLPKHGVFKEEIQLFLKRLRISLDRLHYKHNLRYFACAEYGLSLKARIVTGKQIGRASCRERV